MSIRQPRAPSAAAAKEKQAGGGKDADDREMLVTLGNGGLHGPGHVLLWNPATWTVEKQVTKCHAAAEPLSAARLSALCGRRWLSRY